VEIEFNSFDALVEKLLQLKGRFAESVDVVIEALTIDV
jgi:hypothetical protein